MSRLLWKCFGRDSPLIHNPEEWAFWRLSRKHGNEITSSECSNTGTHRRLFNSWSSGPVVKGQLWRSRDSKPCAWLQSLRPGLPHQLSCSLFIGIKGKEVTVGTKYHGSTKHKTAGLAGVENRGQGQIKEDKDVEKAKTHLGLGKVSYTQQGIQTLSWGQSAPAEGCELVNGAIVLFRWSGSWRVKEEKQVGVVSVLKMIC